ncbi:MAG TPA: hypothetical protein VIM12_06095 [Noviherbaspirillum sp.]|jgi:hypothetical protein|uniref:hypothetical protein n=1 Tax=Noviherbaspirillum sp. TaxID=1926288 RepID=UPI002F921E3D
MSEANESKTASSASGLSALTAFAGLKPKGACWYCNQPVDNVRRFCSKDCADDYRTEEESFSTRPV